MMYTYIVITPSAKKGGGCLWSVSVNLLKLSKIVKKTNYGKQLIS